LLIRRRFLVTINVVFDLLLAASTKNDPQKLKQIHIARLAKACELRNDKDNLTVEIATVNEGSGQRLRVTIRSRELLSNTAA
jgi:hypothetical protein